VEASGARLVVISSEAAEEGRAVKAEHELPFPLLVDEGAEVIRAYEVFHENESKGREITRPAGFVLDAGGTIRWAYVGERASDRPKLDAMLAAVS
jgi:peroxiredoxin